MNHESEGSPSGSDVLLSRTTFSSDAPKETSVSISPSGSWVKLRCSSRAKPPVSRFAWFKKSKEGATKVFEGRVYSLNVTDGGVYYCEATNNLGSQPSSECSLTDEGKHRTLWPSDEKKRKY